MAIFNYENIEWSASTEYGGNSMTGLSSTHAAKVIFDHFFKKNLRFVI